MENQESWWCHSVWVQKAWELRSQWYKPWPENQEPHCLREGERGCLSLGRENEFVLPLSFWSYSGLQQTGWYPPQVTREDHLGSTNSNANLFLRHPPRQHPELVYQLSEHPQTQSSRHIKLKLTVSLTYTFSMTVTFGLIFTFCCNYLDGHTQTLLAETQSWRRDLQLSLSQCIYPLGHFWEQSSLFHVQCVVWLVPHMSWAWHFVNQMWSKENNRKTRRACAGVNRCLCDYIFLWVDTFVILSIIFSRILLHCQRTCWPHKGKHKLNTLIDALADSGSCNSGLGTLRLCVFSAFTHHFELGWGWALGEKCWTPEQHSQALESVVEDGSRNSRGDQRLPPAPAEQRAAQLVKSEPGAAPPLEWKFKLMLLFGLRDDFVAVLTAFGSSKKPVAS